MGENYTTEQGDCLSLIGERHNIPWKKIWEHPNHQALREQRGNPNILYPGDKVFIPDKEEKQEDGASERKHSFKRPGKSQLKIQILDLAHEPLAGVKYRYVCDGKSGNEKQTGSDGLAQTQLPRGCTSVKLKLPWGTFPVEVGHLDPTRTIRGIQQRLLNLGIDPGPIDGIYGPLTARGIRSFQAIEGLEITGGPGKEFIKRLRDVHDRQSLQGQHNDLEEHPPEETQIKPRGDVERSVADPVINNPPATHIEQEEFPVPGYDPVEEA